MPDTFQQPQSATSLDEQFVSEQIPIGLPWRIMLFAVVILGLSIFVYFGLRFGYRSYLISQKEQLEQKTTTLANQVSAEEQEKLIGFYSQLTNLKKVLDTHSFNSNVFGFLEKNTLPTIFFDEVNFIASDNSLTLKGQAASLRNLVNQMAVFDGASELTRVVLNQTSFDKGNTVFALTINFKQEFFSKPN